MDKKEKLQDKIVLVTGASKGIGKAIAKAFSQEGAKVSICARNKENLETARREIQKNHQKIIAIQADLTDEKQATNVIEQTLEKFKGIDIIVNNVGGAIRFGDFWELGKDDWHKSFDLNVMSMVYMLKKAMPYLKKSNSPSIINISSISGVEPGWYNPHYSTMKAATINLTKHLANILAPDGIRVNVVCPGTVSSDSLEQNILQNALKKKQDPEQYKQNFLKTEKAKIPLGRIGEGKDISKLVLFLAGEGSSWITGSCFHINGGKLRSMY